MALPSNSAPAENNRRQPKTGPLDAPHPVKPSSTPPVLLAQSTRTKRKGLQDPEVEADEPQGVHPSKRPRKLSPHELSEKTLREDSVAEADKPEGVRYSEEPQVLPSLTPPVQPSPTFPAPISQPASTKRKRQQDPEAEGEAEADEPKVERPAKQPRRSTPPRLGSEQPQEPPLLSKADSESLRSTFEEVMASAVTSALPGSIKRSSSQLSLTTQGTKASSGTNAHYRYYHLAAAEVYIYNTPPDHIQKAIDAVFEREVSEERRLKLKAISRTLHLGCVKAVKAQAGEDDFVELFHDALKAMHHDTLCLHQKADWREELKPVCQQSLSNLAFVAGSSFPAVEQQQEVDVTSSPPLKRQHQSAREPQPASQTYISPQSSMTNVSTPTPAEDPPVSSMMPPPAPPSGLEKDGDRTTVKTARPDISMGIQVSVLHSALARLNLKTLRAKKFFSFLQHKKVYREGLLESALIAIPASRALDLAFPFAVVEGKAYSTGKQIFEAENQAAVSGACALKIQLCLDDLVKRATADPDATPTSTNISIPLVFSITTQGPTHELWVHYIDFEDGVRTFNSALLETSNGALLKTVEPFMVAVDSMCFWGCGSFLDSVMERLGKVARDEIRNARA